MSMENRVAVITGATGGLGRVVAKILAAQGARLALISTNREKLEELAQELQLRGEQWMSYAVDLGDQRAVNNAAQAVLEKFGRVDGLLHFVGGWAGGKSVVDVEVEDVTEMLHQHLWTTLYLSQAFVPSLLANGWGRIIAISSLTATRPAAQRAPYAIGKAAQEALVLTLAQELEGTNVTANVLVVNTIDVNHERERAPSPKNATWVTPEEITSAILYLCSDDARMVNGARIPLYGSPKP